MGIYVGYVKYMYHLQETHRKYWWLPYYLSWKYLDTLCNLLALWWFYWLQYGRTSISKLLLDIHQTKCTVKGMVRSRCGILNKFYVITPYHKTCTWEGISSATLEINHVLVRTGASELKCTSLQLKHRFITFLEIWNVVHMCRTHSAYN